MSAMRKNIPGLLLFISLCVHVRFVPATTVIVDTTGLDFQYYWYTGTLGQQIAVDSSGKVHVCYTKTWVTASDTGYQVMYANVSDGIKIPIPSQEPWADIQPGVVYLDGGHHGTPIYLYYGVGSSFYGYRAKMHLQALAKLSDDCKRIVPLGLQDDFNGYHEVFIIPYANPIELEVDYLNGIVHCINTNPSGSEVIYWNFDGTNFSIRYFMLNADTDNGYCGKYVPSRFRRNGTRGADLTISVNGEEVTIATLHPACNILLHKGILKGSVWADNFFKGLADGSVVALYDTTNSATGENISNNNPKPFTEVQVCYDVDNHLHVVYEATYIDSYFDTSAACAHLKWWWGHNLYGSCGDTNAVFYDGSIHPKPQLRYWNDITKTHTLVAECHYPLAGEIYKWFSYGIPDSGVASWGKYINDSPIANVECMVNKNQQLDEPYFVCVWEEMQDDVIAFSDTHNTFGHTYYAYRKDIWCAVSDDGQSWSSPYNITDTVDKDESDVSVYHDVSDNKIRHFMVPIRKETTEQVKIIYRDSDLTNIQTGINAKTNMPSTFELAQNYPNPFNPATTIQYTVPGGQVTMMVYNVLGQKIKTLVDKVLSPSFYQVVWDGTNDGGDMVTTGIYLCRLKTEAGVKTIKMLLQK